MANNRIVFLAAGVEAVEQLEIVLETHVAFAGNAEIVVYTDVPEKCRRISQLSIAVRSLATIDGAGERYRSFGTTEFAALTRMKAVLISEVLNEVDGWVLYCDTDIVALRHFEGELDDLMRRAHIVVSDEGRGICPKSYCTGLIACRDTPEARQVLDGWRDHHAAAAAGRPALDDQSAFDELMFMRADLEQHVQMFSQGVAMPGWYYHFLYP